MVTCLSCGEDDSSSQQITNIEYTPSVVVGGKYSIRVSVKTDIWFGSQYFRLCVFEGSTRLASSESVKIGSQETIDYMFTGTMPDRDLSLKVSLQLEAIGFVEYCQDAKFITIYKHMPGEAPVAPPETIDTDPEPITDKDDDDDKDDLSLWKLLFGDEAEELEGILTGTAIIVVVVLIVILLITKR